MFLNPIDAQPMRPPAVGTGLLGVASTLEVVDENPIGPDGQLARGQRRVLIDGVEVLADDLGSRWEGGYTWLPEGWDVTGVSSMLCSPPDWDTDGLRESVTQEFTPFLVWAHDRCSTVDSDRDRWGRAERALRADQSFHIAGELERGTIAQADTLDNAYLAEADGDVVSLANGTLIAASVALDDRLSRILRNGAGMVHCSPAHLSRWQEAGWVRWNGSTPYTPNGHVIAADAGYRSAASGANSTIYGTDAIRIMLGPIRMSPTRQQGIAGAVDVDTNDVVVRARRAVGIQWDHRAHVKVTVTDLTIVLP